MKTISIVLGLILFSVVSTSVEAKSHFSFNFSNFVAPAPARYVAPPPTYYVEPYPVYVAPQPYYVAPMAPEVVYVRPAPRPVIVHEAPRPVRTGFGVSWNVFR